MILRGALREDSPLGQCSGMSLEHALVAPAQRVKPVAGSLISGHYRRGARCVVAVGPEGADR